MNITAFNDAIEQSAKPSLAKTRLAELVKNHRVCMALEQLTETQRIGVVKLIGFSSLFYRLLAFRPESLFAEPPSQTIATAKTDDLERIKRNKYQALFHIAIRDYLATEDYNNIMRDTSQVADKAIRASLRLVLKELKLDNDYCSVIALGKLGAEELNFSSDVDVIFTFENQYKDEQPLIYKIIRRLVKLLHHKSENGFLYRVDLNLRAWGKTGPMALSVDDSEHYYEMSREPLERFIWLRARRIAGEQASGQALIDNLRPFVYRSSLSPEDLQRFLTIKQAMKQAHKKSGCWNVKQGTGGIRDIEFFVQLLQIANGKQHPTLQATNTIQVLNELARLQLIEAGTCASLHAAYLFLRRLENHLQMIDEQQVHHLPEDPDDRLFLARSLGFVQSPDNENLQQFETTLAEHRATASRCFEDLLPSENATGQRNTA